MVRKLAHERRLLVVFDGVSEFTSKHPPDWAPQIVTSRRAPEGSLHRVVHLSPLSLREDVELLVKTYTATAALPPSKADPFVLTLVDDIEQLRQGAPIRPLFVRLVVEQRLAVPQDAQAPGGAGGANTPYAVVSRYVETLRSRSPTTLAQSSYWRAAKCAAFY